MGISELAGSLGTVSLGAVPLHAIDEGIEDIGHTIMDSLGPGLDTLSHISLNLLTNRIDAAGWQVDPDVIPEGIGFSR